MVMGVKLSLMLLALSSVHSLLELNYKRHANYKFINLLEKSSQYSDLEGALEECNQKLDCMGVQRTLGKNGEDSFKLGNGHLCVEKNALSMMKTNSAVKFEFKKHGLNTFLFYKDCDNDE